MRPAPVDGLWRDLQHVATAGARDQGRPLGREYVYGASKIPARRVHMPLQHKPMPTRDTDTSG